MVGNILKWLGPKSKNTIGAGVQMNAVIQSQKT